MIKLRSVSSTAPIILKLLCKMVVLDILTFFAAISIFLLGSLVYLKRKKSFTNKAYSILAFNFGLWSLALFFYGNPVITSPLNWLRIVYFTGNLLVFSFLLFAYAFPYVIDDYKNLIKAAAILHTVTTPVLFYLLWYTNSFIIGVHRQNGKVIAQMGQIYLFYGIYAYSLFFLSIFCLYKKYKKAQGIPKTQLRLMITAFFTTSAPIIFVDVVLPILADNTELYTYSPIFILVLIGTTAYTIIKHRFLGIKFVLGKSLYHLLSSTIPFSFFYLVAFLMIKIWGSIFAPGAIISGAVITVAYIFVFHKLNIKMRHFFEKTLIYSDYNPDVTINKLLETTSSQTNLDKTILNILRVIPNSLKIRNTGIVIFNKMGNKVLFERFLGSFKNTLKDKADLLDISRYLDSLKDYKSTKNLVYDEICLEIREKTGKQDRILEKIVKIMKRNKIAVISSLSSETKLNGILLIGQKAKKEAFTVQDIDFLDDLVINASSTISRFISSSILYSDTNKALKNFSSPNLLKSSRLLRLKQVKELAKNKGISDIDALREVLTTAIEYLNPEDTGQKDKRTAARLKYEILKMIAFEQATESQIMWDLGFDVYTRSVEEKLSQQREPRFKLKDASEYSATSDRSFKRLKKEAVEMLRWKLESGEK